MRDDAKTAEPAQAGAPATCTLSSDGLAKRLAWVRAEILPHVVASEPIPDGILCELEDAPGLGAKLELLAALESECCPDLAFEIGPRVGPGRRRLAIRGIDARASVFASLPGRAPHG